MAELTRDGMLRVLARSKGGSTEVEAEEWEAALEEDGAGTTVDI